jgi:hypothetical protein
MGTVFDITSGMRAARTIVLVGPLIAAGCQTPSQRPGFVEHSQEDCASGDLSACSMLDALRKPLTEVEPTSDNRLQTTQAEKDADAIMAGIRRARSSTLTERINIAPAIPDDRLLNP